MGQGTKIFTTVNLLSPAITWIIFTETIRSYFKKYFRINFLLFSRIFSSFSILYLGTLEKIIKMYVSKRKDVVVSKTFTLSQKLKTERRRNLE